MRTRIQFLVQQNCKEKIIVQTKEQTDTAQLNTQDSGADMLAMIRRMRRKERIRLLTCNR
ncbi:hypothetical protein SAMN05443582_10794 [Phyllobacterium sp. OV277]|nr:hypothetical protein SAMN05443582_10794 [Phyllobacterium sp. OV277]